MTPRTRCVLAAVTAPLAIALAGCAAGSVSPAASSSRSGSTASSATPASAPATSQLPASPASSVTPGGPMATASASPRTRAAECTSAQLKVAYTSNAQIRHGALNGMSHADSVIMFTNVSSRTCWTRGYPGVAALDAAGHQLKQAVRGRAANGRSPLITLAPGQVASAEVTGDRASCTKLTTFPALLVTVPDQRTSTRLAGSQNMCLGSLGVDPLQPGNSAGLPL